MHASKEARGAGGTSTFCMEVPWRLALAFFKSSFNFGTGSEPSDSPDVLVKSCLVLIRYPGQTGNWYYFVHR